MDDEEREPMTVGELAEILDGIDVLLGQSIRVICPTGSSDGVVTSARVLDDGSIVLEAG